MEGCAIYIRVSSEMQRATSVQDQEAVARRYAADHGWTVLDEHVYSDMAVSGATLVGRPAIQRLMAAAERKPRPFDVVLVDDSSRIARDLPDALRFLELMKFVGVQAIFISQNIDSTHEQADTMVAIHGIVDSLYLKELSKKTKRGLAGQLGRGFATGGRTYGYTSVPADTLSGKVDADGEPKPVGKYRTIVPDEAAVIVGIYEAYAAGKGVGRIVDELNQADVAGPRNEAWRYNTVRRILRNERYRGLLIWGQRTSERRPGKRWKVPRPQDRAHWVTKERPELRIVPDDLWHRVQSRIADIDGLVRRQAGSNLLRGRQGVTQARHLFTSVMRCGVCGGAMAIVAGGHGSPRYGCQQSWRHGVSTCTNRLSIRAKIVDPLLLSGLQSQLKSPEVAAFVTETVSARIAAVLDEGPRRRARLEAERASVQRKLANLGEALENNGATPWILGRIRDRQGELERLEHELSLEAEHLEEKLVVLPSWVQRQLADVAGLLQDEPERARAHFRRIGLSFTVSPVLDVPRPFLRAVGTADLMKATFDREFDFPATGHSRRG